MNALVTRRILLGATAAVGAVGLPAIAEAAGPASSLDHPDAELFDLIVRHEAAWDACERAEAEAARVDALARAQEPPRPVALRYREGDFPRTALGMGLSVPEDDGDRWYGSKAAGWMRDRTASMWFATLVPALGSECEARRVEILEAWDAWRAEIAEVEARVGLPAAEGACTAAADVYWPILVALEGRAPRSLDGLRAKAAWVATHAGRAGADTDDVAVAFARQVANLGGAAA